MPLQNRINPFGALIATPEYGTLMGNRGILHDENRTIVKRWAHHNWILCQLQFKGRQRVPMSAGNYTELFFLDEATGLSAGHRPCAECQRARYNEFKQLFLSANAIRLAEINAKSDSKRMDTLLKQDRLIGRGRYAKQNTYEAIISTLPNGTFIEIDKQPQLIWNRMQYQWSASGYTSHGKLSNKHATVLTPQCTVKTLQAGYRVDVHFSAE